MFMRSPLGPTLAFVAATVLVTGASGARAGCDGAVLFADDFSTPDLSWAPRDLSVFRNGKYVLAMAPNASVIDWPRDVTFSGEYSVCLQVKLPSDPQGAAGSGLIFWVDPAKNKLGAHDYHMAVVSPDGYYWVAKTVDGQRSTVLAEIKGPLVRTGPSEVNELAVTLKGNSGTFFVNGKEIGTFTGQPPAKSHAGLTAGSPLDKGYLVEFSRFRVLKP
jgi:hypothetical protein